MSESTPSGSARDTLAVLWSPLLAITTAYEGRSNGQIALASIPASILPDAPRVLIELWKANLTHDMVLAAGVFALHLLPANSDEHSLATLALIREFGMRSGRDGDKLTGIAWRPGMTGSPILADALSYIEAQVTATLDAGEMTIFLGDVVAGERLRPGEPLTWNTAREQMPPDWLAEYEANQERQRAEARKRRQP